MTGILKLLISLLDLFLCWCWVKRIIDQFKVINVPVFLCPRHHWPLPPCNESVLDWCSHFRQRNTSLDQCLFCRIVSEVVTNIPAFADLWGQQHLNTVISGIFILLWFSGVSWTQCRDGGHRYAAGIECLFLSHNIWCGCSLFFSSLGFTHCNRRGIRPGPEN